MPEIIFGPRRKSAPQRAVLHGRADKHPNWGGRRAGSGRKPVGDKPLDAMVVVRMTDRQKAFYKRAGGSTWIRELLTRGMEAKAKRLASPEADDDDLVLGDILIDDLIPDPFPVKTNA